MSKEKTKVLRRAFWCGVSAFAVAVLLVVIVDPFYHYHPPILGMKTYLYNAVYQTSGVAGNYEYDSAIVGTSMTENFHTGWFCDEMGLNTVKLSYAGARTDDLDAILNQIFRSGNEIKTIYMDINGYQLEVPSFTAYTERPKYLYDDNPFNDVQYICNLDTLSTCIGTVAATIAGREDNMDTAYTWKHTERFGWDNVMEVAAAGKQSQTENIDEAAREFYRENGMENLENIGKHIKAHPETTFVIMYPPYNIMYWDNFSADKLEVMLELYRMSFDYFGEMPNVELYFFMDDYETITNFDYYCDLGHYAPDINYRMFQALKEGQYKADKEEAHCRLNALCEYVKGYDYESIWAEYEQKQGQ